MKKVLIIDDTEANRKTAGDALKASGYDVIDAEDGTEGVYLAKKMTPDLILLDLAMPDVDGIEACRQIRAIGSLKEVPIVMLSAMGDNKLIEIAKAAGANDYIVKPVIPSKLIEVVRKYLKQ